MNDPREFGEPFRSPEWISTDDPNGDDPEHRDAAAERSLSEDVRALVDDGRMFAEAEFDFQKKRLSYATQEGGGIAASFAIGGVFAFFALMALVVGLVLALGQVITYWGSTAVVTLALAILAYVFVARGRAKAAHLRRVVSSEENT